MASVDFYYGQTVEKIVEGDEDWQWAIRLSGGAVIKNWDQRRTAVPEIDEGDGFLLATFSADATKLMFGNVTAAVPNFKTEVVFTPTQYSITDPVYALEEEFPQRNLEDLDHLTSVVYSKELEARTAEGPDLEATENEADFIAEVEEAESRFGTEDQDDAGTSGEVTGKTS